LFVFFCEGAARGNLGNAYYSLGKYDKAISQKELEILLLVSLFRDREWILRDYL